MSLPFRLPRNTLTVLTHISLWVVFLGMPLIFHPRDTELESKMGILPPAEFQFWVAASLNLTLVAFFYFNYAFLVPRFYLRGKPLVYFLAIAVSFTVFNALVSIMRDAGLADATPKAFSTAAVVRFTEVISTVFFVLMWGASFGFRLGEEWRRGENARREADRRRLEAELTLLKSQINPHFLLNSLNNLYALALTEPDKAPPGLLKLSEMVAYILYECDKPRVPLAHDLAFIKNYIALQKLRLPPNAVLTLEIPDTPSPELDIEPMILIPFVENAFKHGLTTSRPCAIFIEIKIVESQLTLHVENQVFEQKTIQNGNVSGIGLANTRQRLEHSYPEKHALKIENNGQSYCVELKIKLTINQSNQSL